MITLENIRYAVGHPLAIAGSAFAAFGWVANIPLLDPFLATIWSNPGPLFTAFSVTTFTIAPEIAWLPKGPLTVLTLALGMVFVASLLWKWGQKLTARLTED